MSLKSSDGVNEMRENSLAAEHIRDIERRAEAAGVKITWVLMSAGVHYSTWWRWRLWLEGDERGQHPQLSTLEQIRDALVDHEARAREGG